MTKIKIIDLRPKLLVGLEEVTHITIEHPNKIKIYKGEERVCLNEQDKIKLIEYVYSEDSKAASLKNSVEKLSLTLYELSKMGPEVMKQVKLEVEKIFNE